MKFKDVRIFLSEVAFSVIKYDLDQQSGLLSSNESSNKVTLIC